MFRVRTAGAKDIDGILAVELNRYGSLHSELRHSRKDLKNRFLTRLVNIKDWLIVAERDGDIVGFLSAIPTKQGPSDFISWEKSTDNGLCSNVDFGDEATNIYVVNLDIMFGESKKNTQYKLMAYLGAKVVRNGYRTLYFESRIPSLRKHIFETIGRDQWELLSTQKRTQVVRAYVEGSLGAQAIDRLVKFYLNNGFKLHSVLPEAFDDPDSLNFGVVFFMNNPYARQNRILRILYSKIINLGSLSPRILRWLIG